jgi:hypothetical protein
MVAVWGCALVLCGQASLIQAQDVSAADDFFAQAKPIAIDERDSPLRKLLKQRRNVALEEMSATHALYRGGRVALDDVVASTMRFGNAGLELAETPAERIKYREAVLALAKTVESIVRVKHDAEVEPVQAMARATYARLDAEIALLREREAAK